MDNAKWFERKFDFDLKAMRVIDLAFFVAEHDDHHLYQLVRT